MNILEAIRDRKLLGASPAFVDLSTWRPWLTFLAAVYGLPLDAEGEALFKQATGRSAYDPPPGGWREVIAIVGRQAGKTRIAAALTTFEAATCPTIEDGEQYAILVGQDLRASLRVAYAYVRATFEASDVLRTEVTARTSDTLSLRNHVRIATYPCRPAAMRGLRARVAVVDELAFFKSTEGVPTDRETLVALRPALATTGGRLIVLSSPYAASGALFDLHRRHYGRDGSNVLVWQADAPTMNPTLPRDYLERMREEDPEAALAEVDAQFRRGLALLFDLQAIDACVYTGCREHPPHAGLKYVGFCDPSGGRRDSFTAAVAHRYGKLATLDALRVWPAPFDPRRVTMECCQFLKTYNLRMIVGDRYAGEWPRAEFKRHGISYRTSERDRSTLYLELLAAVNSRNVSLLDHPQLLRELRGLERRTTRRGVDSVDHPRSGHDDAANAAAGALVLLVDEREERALEASDRIMRAINSRVPLSSVDRMKLDAYRLRRQFELGLIDEFEYQEMKKHEIPVGAGYTEVFSMNNRLPGFCR